MEYEMIVTNAAGKIIYSVVHEDLHGVVLSREVLHHYFVDGVDWEGEYANLLTVFAKDVESGARLELKCLRMGCTVKSKQIPTTMRWNTALNCISIEPL